MASCLTCGSLTDHPTYTCPSCEGLTEIGRLREDLEAGAEAILDRIEGLAQHHAALRRDLSEGMAVIASAMEWGFGEISWQLEQQTAVLTSIEHTLEAPAKTQANELRSMAEELRARGLLDEAERRFLKALELNPLDYRTYVGLAHTYLQSNKLDDARSALEKSLPHAPQHHRAGAVLDWRSYSYRLIGRIHACSDDYGNAAICLRSSIKLSPEYAEGHYDYAQYCAQTGNAEACLGSLKKAISAKPMYWYLAHHERNFNALRAEVQRLLVDIKTDASRRAERVICDAGTAMARAREAVAEAEQALRASREKGTLDSKNRCKEAGATLELAKSKVVSAEYLALLDAPPTAAQARALADDALCVANQEREHYRRRKRENVRRAWGRVPGALYGWPQLFSLIGWIPGALVGALIGAVIDSTEAARTGAAIGVLAGALAGLALGIRNIWKELHGRGDS